MSSNTVHCVDISEEILNGIHPNTNELLDKKTCNKNRRQKNYFGIPEDILDGIHPKVETQHLSDDEDVKTKKIYV